jgi:succinoglycan biosynthesis protein ExoA
MEVYGMMYEDRSEEFPFVSVIIPVRNEEKYIRQCMQSLLMNDYPPDRIEFIIVDGASTDRTRDAVFEMLAVDPRIKLLNNPNRTVPYSMNIGIRAAEGEYIVRVDAHAEYCRDYIRKSIETLQDTGAANVGGVWVVRPASKGFIARAIALAQTHIFGVGNSSYRVSMRKGYKDTVPFGAFRRTIFEKVGLFNEKLTCHQDYELNLRIRKSGGGIYMNPAIVCKYYCRAGLRTLWKQSFQYGKWNAYCRAISKENAGLRHTFPGLVAAIATVLGVAAIVFKPAMWAFFGCATFYLSVSLLASLQLLKRDRDVAAFFCPIVFPILHFGRGFGLIWGLATRKHWVENVWQHEEAPMLEPLPEKIIVRSA